MKSLDWKKLDGTTRPISKRRRQMNAPLRSNATRFSKCCSNMRILGPSVSQSTKKRSGTITRWLSSLWTSNLCRPRSTWAVISGLKTRWLRKNRFRRKKEKELSIWIRTLAWTISALISSRSLRMLAPTTLKKQSSTSTPSSWRPWLNQCLIGWEILSWPSQARSQLLQLTIQSSDIQLIKLL